jgi:hypothetical protein
MLFEISHIPLEVSHVPSVGHFPPIGKHCSRKPTFREDLRTICRQSTRQEYLLLFCVSCGQWHLRLENTFKWKNKYEETVQGNAIDSA